MKRILSFIIVSGATAMLLSSCQKNDDAAPQSNQSAVGQSQSGGYLYNVELSANLSGNQGGGLWFWLGLQSGGHVDYAGADCGHGGAGSTSDKGDATWAYNQTNDSLVISGIILNGLGGFPATVTAPATYGHYSGGLSSFITLPFFVPTNVGHSNLSVAP